MTIAGKYAQVTNNPENDGCINAVLLVWAWWLVAIQFWLQVGVSIAIWRERWTNQAVPSVSTWESLDKLSVPCNLLFVQFISELHVTCVYIWVLVGYVLIGGKVYGMYSLHGKKKFYSFINLQSSDPCVANARTNEATVGYYRSFSVKR